MDEIGTGAHFIRAWTTYIYMVQARIIWVQGRPADFIRAVLQIEHSANGPKMSIVCIYNFRGLMEP